MDDGRTLRLRARREDGLVFTEKMAGLNTHAADAGRVGWVELLQEDLGLPLFVVHRLDAGTSGAIVFAESREAAAGLAKLFETRDVKKKYLFLTDRKFTGEEVEVKSFIEKRGSKFVSDRAAAPNAVTRFRRLKTVRAGTVWEAFPETGKPHQIRLHAQDLGMPILGDAEHGGTWFGRLCLHSASIEFPWRGRAMRFESSVPAWTEDLGREQALVLDAVRQRAGAFDLAAHPEECLRLAHRESDLCRVDRYGEQLVVSWYADRDPAVDDERLFEALAKETGRDVFVRKMQNKGADSTTKTTWSVGVPRARWTARENGVLFELRTDSGHSPGLFLDQRENRLWVRRNAADKRVLNLFSYTGGFSVNAALGGAREVTTVDVSAGFNDWTRANFVLNGLDPAKGEFWAQDCLLFLKGAAKRGRRWDLILCDPPSFGRSKEGVFQIQKAFPELLDLCLSVLEPDGRLLFSTNYEQWTTEDLRAQITKRHRRAVVEPTPRPGLDFERPHEEPLMKSILVR